MRLWPKGGDKCSAIAAKLLDAYVERFKIASRYVRIITRTGCGGNSCATHWFSCPSR